MCERERERDTEKRKRGIKSINDWADSIVLCLCESYVVDGFELFPSFGEIDADGVF